MDLMDSETTFRYVIDIKQEKKIYFIIVFRQMFYSVYINS